MELSRVLKEVVRLERHIAQLYAETAKGATDAKVVEILRLMSDESQIHAEGLESRYEMFETSLPGEAGIEEVVLSLKDRIVGLGESKDCLSVLREGIKLEGKIGELYQEISEMLEVEEKAVALLKDTEENGEEKASKILWKIAMEEIEHQRILSNAYEALLRREGHPY